MRYSAFFPHSHKIKRHLFLGRKAMTNLDITLPTNVHIVKAMVFPVIIYRCESWTIKKAECQSIDVFKLWCWKDPWDSHGPQEDQTGQSQRKSTLNIQWKDWFWSQSSNTLATWCEELTHWKRPRCWERLKAGGKGDDRGQDGWMASRIQWTWIWANSRR